ncbi:DUF2975 domain-containing protein [Nocardioides pyridinolyticus]
MTWAMRAVPLLKILLVGAFLLTVVFQTLSMPGQFRYMAQENPDLAHLRWPLTAWAVLELLCVQVVIVCVWRLLGMVREQRIFTERAFVWVDAILAAMVTAWVMLAGLSLWAVSQADDPGGPMALFAVVLASAVVVLLLVVMRELLRQATVLRTDLDGVI